MREQLIEAARRREIDVVLVWRLDRWGSSVTDLLATLQEQEHLGVGFVSLIEALDLTTPAGRAWAGLLAVFAEFEREILRERVCAGLVRARQNGKQRAVSSHSRSPLRSTAKCSRSAQCVLLRLTHPWLLLFQFLSGQLVQNLPGTPGGYVVVKETANGDVVGNGCLPNHFYTGDILRCLAEVTRGTFPYFARGKAISREPACHFHLLYRGRDAERKRLVRNLSLANVDGLYNLRKSPLMDRERVVPGRQVANRVISIWARRNIPLLSGSSIHHADHCSGRYGSTGIGNTATDAGVITRLLGSEFPKSQKYGSKAHDF